ncbi:hypothetical protein [Phytohabitans houttuyneae]|nr:hypothetical protein [Phytohabitans houttuyneae]
MKGGRRFVMRAAVVGLGLAGLALTVPTFAASKDKKAAPARHCCAVKLDGPARTVTAGGEPASFDLVVSRSDKGCTQTRRTITVRLKGLATEHVRLERVVSGQVLALRETSAEPGTVEAVDPLVDSKLICGKDTAVAASYRIAFLEGSPFGRAELVVSAHAVSGKLLDSARATTAVVEAVGSTTPPPETAAPETTAPPPVTEAPVEETTAPPLQQAPVPPDSVARPPLRPAAEVDPLSTTLLTASIVFALAAMLLVGVLWRLRRTPTADEAPTTTLPPGVGAELAMLQEGDGAAGHTRPAAP